MKEMLSEPRLGVACALLLLPNILREELRVMLTIKFTKRRDGSVISRFERSEAREPMTSEWRRDEYTISTDRERLNVSLIHNFLSDSAYWARSRSLEKVQQSIEHSLNFGVYKGDEQIGFARVVTDYATFAWLADVFILDEYRGRGLSKWL